MSKKEKLSNDEYEQIIGKLERINDELLNTVLMQSRYIRELEGITRVKLVVQNGTKAVD